MKLHRLFFTLSALSLGAMGCSSAPALQLTSLDHHQTYQQGFTNAYTARNANGDTDVVLVDEATEQAIKGNSVTSPVRQIMHIRILWSPTRDMKAIVSNAAVKWYVIGCSQTCDMLEYSGIAFVSMHEEDGTSTLRVQNTLLKPSANHGQLTDPVGACRLEGTFVAHQDAAAVERVLSHVKSATVAASAKPPTVSALAQ